MWIFVYAARYDELASKGNVGYIAGGNNTAESMLIYEINAVNYCFMFYFSLYLFIVFDSFRSHSKPYQGCPSKLKTKS